MIWTRCWCGEGRMDGFELAARLERAGRASEIPIEIEPGSREDLAALGRFHYCAGVPATVDLVLRARVVGMGRGALASASGARPAGVLVVSRAVLNGAWRELAWPGRFSSGDRMRDARAINERLRCISRVIVEARFRGLSIARRLVRAYLDEPLSEATESIAAMGAYCPFFERAGMARIELGPTRRDRRLLDVLGAHQKSAVDLLAIDWGEARMGEVARALRVWARGSRSTRAHAGASEGELAWLAARRLVRPRRVFVHGRGDFQPRCGEGVDG